MLMKMTKRLLSILLSLVMVLGLMPGMSLTAYAASSGKNGGFNWTLDDDGKMTVTGSGALPESFIDQNGNIKSIVFDENCQVSGLAQRSIYWANNATEIIINSTADLTIAGSAIWYSSYGGDPVSITINAPKVTIAGSEPFFAYGRQLNITVNTNELIVYNGTMSYLGGWNSNNSFAYPANSTVYIPAGYVFTQSFMQVQYDRMAQYGEEDMFWQDYGNRLEEGRDYTYNAEASSVALTSENAGTVFGGAQTSSSNAYTAAHNHSFTYSASGATITATCGGTGICDITGGLTLTISAPTGNLVYDGTTTYPAALSTGYNTTAFPDTYSISYTKDGSAYSGVPKDAGTYTASVTAGTGDAAKTASVSYTIAKAAATATKAPTAKTLTYTGSPQALVSAGTAEGGEMQYALGTATKATEPYTTSIPTATNAGTYYVWYKVAGDSTHTDSTPACVTVTIGAKIVYIAAETSATVAEHTIGSGQDAVLVFHRSVDDANTINHFASSAVDGKTLSTGEYTVKSGSLILTLKASYLDTLTPGAHRVTATFDDGTADTTIQILEALPTPAPTNVPKTGDGANLGLWLTLMLSGLLLLGGWSVYTIRKRG